MSKRSNALVGENAQEKLWAGPQGNKYVQRFFWTPEQVDAHWLAHYSQVPRTELFKPVFHNITKESSILEVGCNCGNQLEYLHRAGYTNLSGIDINALGISTIKAKRPWVKAQVSSAAKLPFPNKSFDMVMTCWCLCHLPPDKYKLAVKEIQRVCKKFVFISEPYSNTGEICVHKDYIWARPVASDIGGGIVDHRFVVANGKPVTTGVFLLDLEK